MNRGKSQQSRQKQSKLKYAVERTRPNQSKNKLNLDTSPALGCIHNKNGTIYTSPAISKAIEQDKQNTDLSQKIIKIITDAVESPLKQILISLDSKIQKQKKYKKSLNKQSTTDKNQLLVLLKHLKEQQSEEIDKLKMQVRKRKMLECYEYDLEDNLVNLNSYVMRRTKRQSLEARANGIDLITQIYNKFDEQYKLISKLIGAGKTGNRCNNLSQKQKQSIDQLMNTKKNFQNTGLSLYNMTLKSQKNQSDLDSNSNINSQISNSSTRSELMQKIRTIGEDKLKLIKQVTKIQQQFQCLVQQKLILEQRLQRVQTTSTYNKNIYKKQLKIFKNLTHELNKKFVKQKIEIMDMLGDYNRFLQYEVKQNLYFLQQQNLIGRNQYQIINSPQVNKSQAQYNQNINSCQGIKQSLQCQTGLFDKYQALLTEKQFQINSLLKTIAKINKEKDQIKSQLYQQKQKYQKNMQLLQKIKQKFLKTKSVIQSFKQQKNRIKQQIVQCLYCFKQCNYSQTANLQQKIQYLMIKQQYKNQTHLSQTQQHLSNQINKQQKIIQNLSTQNSELSLQKQKWQKLYKQQSTKNEKQKHNFIQQITRIQNTLKYQQVKAEQNINDMKNSMDSLARQNIQNLQIKYHYIQELQTNAKYFQQKIIYKQNKIQQLNTIIAQLDRTNKQLDNDKLQLHNKYKKLQKQLQQIVKQNRRQEQMKIQMSQHDNIINKLNKKSEDERNLMIEQCGMLLQRKSQQIQLIRLQLDRQKFKYQELLSKIQQKFVNKLCIKNKLIKIKQQIATLKDNLRIFYSAIKNFQLQNTQLNGQNLKNSVILYQNSNKRQLSQLALFSTLFDIKLKPFQIQINVDQCLKQLEKHYQSTTTLTFQDNMKILNHIQILKTKLIKLGFVEEYQHMQWKIVRNNNQRLKVQKIIGQNQQQLNNCQAISQTSKQQEKIIESSSFLFEFQKDKDNYVQMKYFNISEIINESIIVQEVSALRNELAESIKKNQTLQKQLKLYQQKDMDKIFDF